MVSFAWIYLIVSVNFDLIWFVRSEVMLKSLAEYYIVHFKKEKSMQFQKATDAP